MAEAKLPLLTNTDDDDFHLSSSQQARHRPHDFSFDADQGDIQPINGARNFFGEFYTESKKLWYLAGPAIFTSVCQYSIGALTQVFAGQVGTIELAAVSVENSAVAAFASGIMLGMESGLETLCGQAFGAGQLNMLGVYMQRSWVILNATALALMFVYIFAEHILKLIGQTPDISKWAGTFAVWMIPQMFAYAFNYPIQKFLQAQSKITVMAIIAAVAVAGHALFSWLFMLELGWGLVGAAVVLNASWWLIVVAQLSYIFSGACGEAWSGFSWNAFQNLGSFVKLSLKSAVMICLEYWYFMALVLFAGYLKNAEIAVDAFSICMNILNWTIMVANGFNAAVSVRVSNELGAGHSRKAKFSVVVVTLTSFLVGILLGLVLIISRRQYPALFSNSKEVQQSVYDLTPLLVVGVMINSVQPTVCGVTIGAGWQGYVAYVNIICYYVFGIPVSLVLGYALNMGVQGIWIGMLSGLTVQSLVLISMICKTNWEKEASIAGDRIKQWGGETETQIIEDNIIS